MSGHEVSRHSPVQMEAPSEWLFQIEERAKYMRGWGEGEGEQEVAATASLSLPWAMDASKGSAGARTRSSLWSRGGGRKVHIWE